MERTDERMYKPTYVGDWEKIELVMDSGACTTVTPKDCAIGTEIKETESSRKGLNFRAANLSTIKNYGQRTPKCKTNEGVDLGINVQVADVRKPLGAVRQFCKAGDRVVFDEDGSFIQNKQTGKVITLRDKGVDYILDLWTKGPTAEQMQKVNTGMFNALMSNDDEDEEPPEVMNKGSKSGFTRQELSKV